MTSRQLEDSFMAINSLQNNGEVDRAFVNRSVEQNLVASNRKKQEKFRPKNTVDAYKGPQKKFKDWCESKGYKDTLALEERIMWYVDEKFEQGMEVRKKNEDGTITTHYKCFAFETLKQDIKALVDLNKKDQAENAQRNIVIPKARGDALQAFEHNLKNRVRERSERDHADPQQDSIRDSYVSDDLRRVSCYYFDQKKHFGSALRDRMTFLMNHHMMLRGETLRSTHLNHTFLQMHTNEGTMDCPVMVIMILNGKTNQSHQKLYSGVMRHRDVELCAFSAAAFYLFYRFDIDVTEGMPDFSTNTSWFYTKLARGNKKEEAISYNAQLRSINRAFDTLKIHSSKKTHAGRKSGATDAEMAGLSTDHIRRVGRWMNTSLENNYLSSLPIATIRIMHGYGEEKGSFWLSRALVTPSEQLQKMIFKDLEHWEKELEEGRCEHTFCTGGFLELLKYMRIIILQDAVLIKQRNPDNKILQAPVFSTTEFLQFEQNLTRVMIDTSPPAELQLRAIAPQINQRIDTLASQLQAFGRVADSQHQQEFSSMLDVITSRFDNLEASINSIARQQRVLQMAYINGDIDMQQYVETSGRSADGPSEASSSTAGDKRKRNDDHPAVYTLKRNLKTISDVWKEWTLGIEDGPSVNFLNEKYKTSWRSSTKERKYYSNRKAIIDKIKTVSEEKHITLDEAVLILEDQRSDANKTLHQFMEMLVEERQQLKKQKNN